MRGRLKIAIKLTKIELSGFRGIRNKLTISLPSSSSVLIFGENGGGKSSVTDGVEWFFGDRVGHLSTQEIGRHGIPVLRNTRLSDDENAYVEIETTVPSLSAVKTLSVNRSRFASTCSNSSPDFVAYMNAAASENFILRYRDLLDFIVSTKAEKLEALSKIIGFGEVAKTKKTLRRSANELRRRENARDFEGQVGREQAEIIERLGQNVTTDTQFLEAAKALLEPLNLNHGVNDMDSLLGVISRLKRPADEKVISLALSYGKVLNALEAIQVSGDACHSSYRLFFEKYQKMREDSEKISALIVERLLTEGVSVMEGTWEYDSCPLCLQFKDRTELMEDLKTRQEQLSYLRKEYNELVESKANVESVLQESLAKVTPALEEHCLDLDGNQIIKLVIEETTNSLRETRREVSNSSVFGDENIVQPEEFLKFENVDIVTAISLVEEKKKAVGENLREDYRFAVVEKLAFAERAYRQVVTLREEQTRLRCQIDSMESICREFIKRERDSLTQFLDVISDDINDMYQFMNTDERVEGIRLVPLGEDDEFVGVSLEMNFHGELVSPPDGYLSESHVNCLGICLFLASATAFNKTNQFLILDDVISSFDTEHRVRFGHLLKERFSTYQILLLTHEKTWFDFMTSLVRGVGWKICKVVWEDSSGVVLKPAPEGLKSKITDRLAKSDTDGLGNTIRTYFERTLKDICVCLEVRLKFIYNDRNEDRMIAEMLPALMTTLKRYSCDLKDVSVVRRMIASNSLANKLSHDTSLVTATGDLKALWADVVEFEQLFLCSGCSRMISTKKADYTGGTISCNCGSLTYDWKR